jgi:ABC-type sulfate transport system permease component
MPSAMSALVRQFFGSVMSGPLSRSSVKTRTIITATITTTAAIPLTIHPVCFLVGAGEIMGG